MLVERGYYIPENASEGGSSDLRRFGESVFTPMDIGAEQILDNPEKSSPLECRVLPDIDGFNATTFLTEDGMRVVVYRKPIEDIAKWGQPDYNHLLKASIIGENKGSIVEGELTADFGVKHKAVIWTPEVAKSSNQPLVCNLEDLRAGTDGFCGLTVVEKKPGSSTEPDEYTPFAGVVRLPNSAASVEQAFGKMPEVTILRKLGRGKNLTPIGKAYNNQETLLFRPEGDKYSHTLQVVTYDEETKETEVVDELVFPETSWSKWRIGTVAGLFWLDEKHAILPIHGINKEKSAINAEGLYDYSLGAALIEKDESGRLQVVKVSDEPLIVPDQLDHLIGERFPGRRRIVYSCGVWLEEAKDTKGSVFNFLVNKGDKGTILVKIPLKQVIASLNSPEENQLYNVA